MLTEVQDRIITLLGEVSGPALVDSWMGDDIELLTQAAKVPALYLVYAGRVFEAKSTIGSDVAAKDLSFLIVLLNKDLKSRRSCSEACNTIIEAVEAKLKGADILGYGWAWPESEELIHAGAGTLMYGLRYRIHLKKT